jgi:uncharacterized protein YecT (DUF1311 family)
MSAARGLLACAALAVLVAAPSLAAGIDPVLDDPILHWTDHDEVKNCETTDTTFEMNVCAGRALKAVYLPMVALYNKLYAQYDAPNRKLLQASQRAWRDYERAECSFETNGTVGGTINSTMVTDCVADLTKQRLARLKAQADCEEGDMSCNHP